MNYTLADFIDQKIIPEMRLVTKDQDFSRIPVRSASVQELPPENLNFVRPDEIVLSTGIGSDKDPGCLLELLRGAGAAGAAAVVFSLKTEPVPFPSAAVRFADSISLPVFLMPWKYRFSVIQSRLLAAIQEKEMSVFKQIQNALFNDFFETASLSDAASHISAAFGCSAEILDDSGRPIGRGGPFSGPTGESDKPAVFTEIPIRIGSDLLGRLLLSPLPSSASGTGSLPDDPEILEKYVAFPLSLWFNRKRIEDLTAARIRNDFVWNLASGNYSSFDEMTRQGHYLNFDLEKPYTCLIMQMEFTGDTSSAEYSAKAAEISEQAEKVLTAVAAQNNLTVMAAGLNRKFILYLENAGNRPEAEVQNYADMAENGLREVFPSVRCFWGISESPAVPGNFERLYKNASLALQYSISEKGKNRRFTYKDTKKALIISALASHHEIRESAEDTLGKLLEYDSASDMGLLQTLTEFIRCNYNTSRAARELHIHRQSLLYRLEKIEDLTGMSLSSHDDLFLLEIFSRIYASY